MAFAFSTQGIAGFQTKLAVIVVVTALAALAHARAHRLRAAEPASVAQS